MLHRSLIFLTVKRRLGNAAIRSSEQWGTCIMNGIHRELSELHPAIRDSVKAVLDRLAKEKIPFKLFEAFRMPARQRFLFNKGRTTPGPKVTFQDAWGSFHQYGLAADFALFENGEFNWNDSGSRAAWWTRLHEIGREFRLVPVSFEKPHLQIAGLESSDLRAGRFPPGDASWNKAFQEALVSWPVGAPAMAVGMVDKPPLNFGPGGDPAGAGGAASPGPGESAAAAPGTIGSEAVNPTVQSLRNFERAQEVVREFEGGFVNDPQDPGGPTNFGITHVTLAKWRNVSSVTATDVENMTYGEAKQIYKSLYWDRNNCGRLPGALALAVYNVSVHCGTQTGAAYLQRALNKNGASLAIDNDVGDNTITAVGLAPVAAVLAGVIDLYEERLRGHPNFQHFKNGFMRRVGKLRDETSKWLREDQSVPVVAGEAVSGVSIEGEKKMDSKAQATLRRLLEELNVLLAATGQVTPIALPVAPVAEPAAAPIGPVNGALGETVGKLLNGKKSAIGIIGALVTSVLQNAPPESAMGTIGGALGKALPMLAGSGGTLLPVFLAMTAWGGLGKLEKWLGREK